MLLDEYRQSREVSALRKRLKLTTEAWHRVTMDALQDLARNSALGIACRLSISVDGSRPRFMN